MARIKIRFSTLLRLSELDFVPEPPTVLSLSDELIPVISWLTGATGHDRKFLRCDDNGALLVADGWSGLAVVENDQLDPTAGTPDVFTATVGNKGVLVASSCELVKITFVRVSGGATEDFYMPPGQYLWYPHPTYSVTVTVVPTGTGTDSYVGLTAFD